MRQMKILCDWVFAVFRAWYGWLPGSALAALTGYGQSLGWIHPGKNWYFVILAVGFLFSMFVAWKKEYIENRNGPDVLMEWDSKTDERRDVVRLRNIGRTSALRVELLDFSWAGYSWHQIVQFQSIHPGEPELRAEAQFGTGNTIGNMYSTLLMNQGHRKIPLSVSLRFFDSNNTEFIRTFLLRPILPVPSVDSNSYVIVETGKLKIIRH